jgi:hypothetical protein
LEVVVVLVVAAVVRAMTTTTTIELCFIFVIFYSPRKLYGSILLPPKNNIE